MLFAGTHVTFGIYYLVAMNGESACVKEKRDSTARIRGWYLF